jgi:hypothetical protein
MKANRTLQGIGANINLALTLCISLLASCQSSEERYVQRFDAFIDRVARESDNYSSEDWNQKDLQFEEFMEEFERIKRRLTTEQKEHIEYHSGRYLALRTKAATKGFLEDLEGGMRQLDGFLNELGVDD